MTEELKACPFCHGDAEVIEEEFFNHDEWFVSCKHCKAQSYEATELQVTIAAWNNRVPDPRDSLIASQVKRIAELEAWLKQEQEHVQRLDAMVHGYVLAVAEIKAGRTSMTDEIANLGDYQRGYYAGLNAGKCTALEIIKAAQNKTEGEG